MPWSPARRPAQRARRDDPSGRARPGRRRLQPEGRRRSDDGRGQPGRRGRDGARQEGRPHGRLVPVRRRGRPAQPEPEEQFDRRPRPRARAGRHEVESIDTFVINHTSGIRVLLAPPSPEMAEPITPARRQARHRAASPDARPRGRRLHRVLQRHHAGHPRLRRHHPDDAQPRDHEHQEHAPLPGGRRTARLRDGKVRLVLNRADSTLGIRVADVEHSIGRKVDETIVSDGRSVVYALNRGIPFFVSNREAQVSQDILRLAKSVVGDRSRSRPPQDDQARPTEEVPVRMALIVSTVIVEAYRPSGREGV